MRLPARWAGNYAIHGKREADARGGEDETKHGNAGEEGAFLFS